MEILPSEEKIVGAWWVQQSSRVVADHTSNRINLLIKNSLIEVATLAWQVIYQDKVDGRYWLLDYPESHLHGGGPPSIECVSKEAVEKIVNSHDN